VCVDASGADEFFDKIGPQPFSAAFQRGVTYDPPFRFRCRSGY
jgi:hypothetical protein